MSNDRQRCLIGKYFLKKETRSKSHSDNPSFFDPIFEKQKMKPMARIIPLFPKTRKPVLPSRPAHSPGFLPEQLEKLRRNIVGDILVSMRGLVRKVLLFPHKEWMTAEQVQLKLNLSAKDLRKLSASGKIPYEEVCGDFYYDAKYVARVLKRQKKPAVDDLH